MPNNNKSLSIAETVKRALWGAWASAHPHYLRALGLSSVFKGARL